MNNNQGFQRPLGPRGLFLNGNQNMTGMAAPNPLLMHQQQQVAMACGRGGPPRMQRMPGPRVGMMQPGVTRPPCFQSRMERPPNVGLGQGPAMRFNQQGIQQNLLASAAGHLIQGHLQKQRLQQLHQHMHQQQLQKHLQQHIAKTMTPGSPGMNNVRLPGQQAMNNARFITNGNRPPAPGHCAVQPPTNPANQPFRDGGRSPQSVQLQRPRSQSYRGQSGQYPPQVCDQDSKQEKKRASYCDDGLYDNDKYASFDRGVRSSSDKLKDSPDKQRYPAVESSRRYSDQSRKRTDRDRKLTLHSSSSRLCPYSPVSDKANSKRSSYSSSRRRDRNYGDGSCQESRNHSSPRCPGEKQDGFASNSSDEPEEGEISPSEYSSSPYSRRQREERMSRDSTSVSTSSSDRSSVRSGAREDGGNRKYKNTDYEGSRKRKYAEIKDWDYDRDIDDRDRKADKQAWSDDQEFWTHPLDKPERQYSPRARQPEPQTVESPPEENIPQWIRSSPADLYFSRNPDGTLVATQRMKELEDTFEEEIVKRAEKVRAALPPVELPPRPQPACSHHHHDHGNESDSSSSSSASSASSDSDEEDSTCTRWMEEMERKKKHPHCLHPELWYNDPGEMNNGPLCRCSVKARKSGIRHDVYPGEKFTEPCDPASNNLKKLYHYHITMSPSINFLTNSPTVIEFDNHEFIFEGFSLFTHEKLEHVPLCKVIRFHIEYTIHFIEETAPEHFTCRSLDLLNRFLFTEILELIDMDWKGFGEGCNRFHIMPRFARSLPENGKEILSINEVLKYLLRSSCPLVAESDFPLIEQMSKEDWQAWVDNVCGMIVTYPGKKPSSVRVDQLDRTKLLEGEKTPPILVHFGIRPAQLSYAGDPAYQKAWKYYVRFKHLLNSKPKVTREDKIKLRKKESHLQEIMLNSTMKREVTVELSSEGFVRTGLKSDICQHALLLPVLLSHLRFHACLRVLEDHLQYQFQDRALLQLALTHTSFRTNYGTNSAHARNSLTNCGLRQVEYGDRRVYYQNTRKRGINILVDIMSRMGKKEEAVSEIPHNERLEFLGDAVVEFLSSVHLFHMFPWLEEGGLSTYRTAIVQNQHLSVLAKNLHLQDFMLYVHGPDLCHESDLRHAMANCFEALMGALFLDGGLEVVDTIFARTLFEDDQVCLKVWTELPLHPLQEDEPGGDRHWVDSSPALQKLVSFEEKTGITFSHIRLLAKAFTHRNVGYNLLTMGHNQRLEFLGDTVLQLIASEYLYRHFPEHHEGHLSLLRSSLVNSRTQAIVCDDLGMTDFVIYSNISSDKIDMKTKQKADLLESFLGSLYVDSGMEFCRVFCDVCFFPRLKDFILNQDWNDPKSQLQQCCLTLRKLGGGEPDIPIYKVIESLGPSNTRKYVVAVYFRGERLATGTGHSIQQAEMSAATNALKKRSELFPILQHQRRFLDKRRGGRERYYNARSYKSRDFRDSSISSSSSSAYSGPGRERDDGYNCS